MAVDIASFKALFSRGQFDYGETLPEIRDADITAALTEAGAVFNAGLYPTTAISDLAQSYLVAHYLACDADAADSGGQSKLLQNSRSVDGVSESLEIMDWMRQPEFSFYLTTYYGQKFLMLTMPYLGGAVYCVEGATTP